MESSESTELLLAHKDSEMAEVQNKLDHQTSECDECVAKCKEQEEILPKVSKLKADSSSRSPPCRGTLTIRLRVVLYFGCFTLEHSGTCD
jgi:hypothetical protein